MFNLHESILIVILILLSVYLFCFAYGDLADAAVALRLRNNQAVSHQKRNLRPQPGMNHEIRLPQEWTY